MYSFSKMPSIAELFNPTFLMFLGIFLLATTLLVVYFESKMREQNHKITSMLSLVSSMAEEMNIMKMNMNSLNRLNVRPSEEENKKIVLTENNLIEVSDDNESSDESNISDNDEESEDDNNSDNNSDDDTSAESISIDEEMQDLGETIEIGKNDVKVFKLNLGNDDTKEEEEDLDIDDLDNDDLDNDDSEDEDDDDSVSSSNHDNKEDIKSFADELKTIDISNLDEPTNHDSEMDYKKMSVAKLRSIVSEKGLSNDPSKLKKPELIKLLES